MEVDFMESMQHDFSSQDMLVQDDSYFDMIQAESFFDGGDVNSYKS